MTRRRQMNANLMRTARRNPYVTQEGDLATLDDCYPGQGGLAVCCGGTQATEQGMRHRSDGGGDAQFIPAGTADGQGPVTFDHLLRRPLPHHSGPGLLIART